MLSVNYDLRPYREYNDYSFDVSNNMTLISQITLMAYNNPERFESLKGFLANFSKNADSDQSLMSAAYCRYADREFDEGIKLAILLLECRPTDLDAWLDVCFFLSQISDGYRTHLNMRFHLYHFIHFYLKYDFREVNKESIGILDSLIRRAAESDPGIRAGYDSKAVFDTEYLILNGACNNNCEICHTPVRLRDYDFEDRIIKNGSLPLTRYIFIKSRKKKIKNFVLKGGEPTLHPDYLKIVMALAAARKDISIRVRTNARVFSDERRLKKHAEANVSNMTIEAGVFSADPEKHDAISRAKGSHAQTVRGMKNVLASGMKASARITLCDSNIGDLPETLDFVLETFGAEPGFEEAAVLLPPPSGENLAKYYPDGVKRLRDAAMKIVAERQHSGLVVTMPNAILALD